MSGQGVVLAANKVGQGVVLADKRQDPTDASGYKTSQ